MHISNHKHYDYLKSFERLDEILDSSAQFEERDEIPNREELTYKNGFYVKCSAIFIDIRDSSSLPTRYQRRTLAKIYRAYISELVAVLSSYDTCKEVNIVGDSVSGIFEAKYKNQTLDIFQASYTIHSLIKTLNYKLNKKGIDEIKIGIGIAKGRALMVQAGYKGSGIKDVVWMGDVVNLASNLCGKGNKDWVSSIVISKQIYNDLEGQKNKFGKPYQGMFSYHYEGFYSGNIIRLDMEDWLSDQERKDQQNKWGF
jgi:class 3 adenylate cyclase